MYTSDTCECLCVYYVSTYICINLCLYIMHIFNDMQDSGMGDS